MKNILCIILFTICFMPKTMLAQEKSLNDYKYVIVPEKFDFLTEKDQYKLNSLTKFLFEKYGFTAILEGEKFPDDLVKNPCSALNADVHSDSGMFSFLSKVNIVLKNCNQQIVFESKEGKSKLKDREFGYQEALRDAFSSIEALNYSYSPSTKTNATNAEKPVETATVTEKTENPQTDLILTKEGETFLLEKQENGFLLKNKTSKTIIAHLNLTSRGNYIYRSQVHNGTAYFDEKGNLVVEYFDVEEGKMKTFSFRL